MLIGKAIGITLLFSFLLFPAYAFSQTVADTAYRQLNPQIVYYLSNSQLLKAFLYIPANSKGPFPVYLWNHGSEKDPKPDKKQAAFWTSHGFIFFKPLRSGHGGNPGNYISDEQKAVRSRILSPGVGTLGNGARARGDISYAQQDAIFSEDIALHLEANNDVRAAIKWIKQQTFADSTKLVVAGGSYGGIQSLLTAEYDGKNNLGIKCFVAASPAAMSWNANWAQRLTRCIKLSNKPIFLMQATNDFNLAPSRTLGRAIDKKGISISSHKIFPVYGKASDHNAGHAGFYSDPMAWKDDMIKFMEDCGLITKESH